VFRLERRQPRMGERSKRTHESQHDDTIRDLKDRLCGLRVQVRDDLQVRAEIIIQAEPGAGRSRPTNSAIVGGPHAILQHQADAGWPFRLTLKQYIGCSHQSIMTFMRTTRPTQARGAASLDHRARDRYRAAGDVREMDQESAQERIF